MDKIKRIRNFAIIAHVDHGKSTLADRLIEECGGLEKRQMEEQVLDSMELEKEKGITIKAQTVKLKYNAKDGCEYIFNLIDTPGHVDFSYEVSRSLYACEGSILVVDASQGVEAQTLANVYQAIDHDHEIIPVLNKIDLPSAEPDRVKAQIEDMIGIDASDAIEVSAKTGQGIAELLEAIVNKLPAPEGNLDEPLQTLLVDSWYDTYLGVIVLVRVVSGVLKRGMKVRMISTGNVYNIDNVGIFTPKKVMVDKIESGDVGFIIANIKEVSHCKIGDTITEDKRPCNTVLPGFKPSLPVVFCGLYPVDSNDFQALKESVEKLGLHDASFEYELESSNALGFGFRCGFLGLLHLEIIRERLEREYNLDLITTAPSVVYKIHLRKGDILEVHNPSDMPDPTRIEYMEEPWIKATIFVPDEYLGTVITLCTEKRGEQINISYVGNRVMVEYRLPLNEVIYDFSDRLKSYTKGYASFDWEHSEYRKSDLVKMAILVNQEPVDALSMIVHKTQAEARGRHFCERLKDLIPRHLFAIPIQAALGGKIIARETISAMRKDVTAKCYGGDVTRKRKLLEKQKAGKKKMRTFGKVEIPQKAFIEALKVGDKKK